MFEPRLGKRSLTRPDADGRYARKTRGVSPTHTCVFGGPYTPRADKASRSVAVGAWLGWGGVVFLCERREAEGEQRQAGGSEGACSQRDSCEAGKTQSVALRHWGNHLSFLLVCPKLCDL